MFLAPRSYPGPTDRCLPLLVHSPVVKREVQGTVEQARFTRMDLVLDQGLAAGRHVEGFYALRTEAAVDPSARCQTNYSNGLGQVIEDPQAESEGLVACLHSEVEVQLSQDERLAR